MMIDIEKYKGAPLIAGILELNRILEEKELDGIDLKVVGGFALMMRGYRDMNSYTDIDYIGYDLGVEINQACRVINEKYHLGDDWLNHDLMLSGSTLEDLQTSTGELHFDDAFELSKIKVSVLDENDLLRMTVISIDTALSAVELGGDFTRSKDFPDIIALMDNLGKTYGDLNAEMGDSFITNPKTLELIQIYEKEGLIAAQEFIREAGVAGKIRQTGEPQFIDGLSEADLTDERGWDLLNALHSGTLFNDFSKDSPDCISDEAMAFDSMIKDAKEQAESGEPPPMEEKDIDDDLML